MSRPQDQQRIKDLETKLRNADEGLKRAGDEIGYLNLKVKQQAEDLEIANDKITGLHNEMAQLRQTNQPHVTNIGLISESSFVGRIGQLVAAVSIGKMNVPEARHLVSAYWREATPEEKADKEGISERLHRMNDITTVFHTLFDTIS